MLALLIGLIIVDVCQPLVADKTYRPKVFSTPLGVDPGPAKPLQSGVGVEKNSFFLAHCGDHQEGSGFKCKLTVTRFMEDFNNKTETISYSFELRELSQNFVYAPLLRVVRLNEEKFIVSWIEYNLESPAETEHVGGMIIFVGLFVNFVIVSTTNEPNHECQTVGTSIISGEIDWKDVVNSMVIHLRGNYFGVTYLYSESGFAHEVFNTRGYRILGPIDGNNLKVEPQDLVVLPFSNPWNSNSVCQSIWYTQERLRIAALLSYSTEYKPSNLMRLNKQCPGGYSTTNNITSACRKVKSSRKKLSCYQRLSSHTADILKLKFGYEPQSMIIRNLPRGDLLTMSSKRLKQGSYGVYITVFDRSNGDPFVSVKFGEFPCSSEAVLADIFPNDAGDYCFSMLPYTGSKFVVKCYPEDVLYEIPKN
ncbi:hypothetical protein QAD02_016899 [Eretmocerus hayati]|uniref:Uncharacterized protein n=1 Tax=Eretmocerus hayati TaxID=131215 RepID=A0ACC2PCR6_9HYME|nr:hypothetical protein QAD02_016899 [Eretmocerus hayati]